jgi:hypothetical protein
MFLTRTSFKNNIPKLFRQPKLRGFFLTFSLSLAACAVVSVFEGSEQRIQCRHPRRFQFAFLDYGKTFFVTYLGHPFLEENIGSGRVTPSSSFWEKMFPDLITNSILLKFLMLVSGLS